MNATTAKILKAATAAMMLLALGMSFSHIAELAAMGGAGWERWVAPVLIDFVAILGKIGTNSAMNARTRRTGRRTLWVAGSLSMAANVGVGFAHQSVSGVAIGAGVVIVALWSENYLEGMALKAPRTPAKAATAPAPAKSAKTPRTPAQRSASAQKAAATRKANAATKTAQAPVVTVLKVPAQRLPLDTRAYV